MKHYLFLLSAAMICGACSPTPQQSDPASTVINPDGTVTFSYRNDSAHDVQVDVQFAGRHAMQRDSLTGLWSLTLGPAVPDIYPYCFVVDGLSIMDDQCAQYFPNEGFKNSLLDIPGTADAPLIHSIQPVPHGDVEYIHYYSSAIQAYNNAIVYLPPSYAQGQDSYPVFYLISGTTDTEEVYYKVGRVNYILDNLIAQGAAQDMIVVLPYGNPAKLSSPSGDAIHQDLFGQDLISDLMPYVESHYRTLADRDHRAIGGFSRGGNQGLLNGLTHLDLFSYLCSYSSFTTTDLPGIYDNAQQTNSLIRLFWTGVGTDDFLYGNARDYTEFLDQKGIRCVKEYTHDKFGHTWMNARYFLDKTLRLLFNPEAAEAAMASATPTRAKTGQEQQFTPGVMARLFPKPILSPEVDGHTVTFRIKAPEAHQVLVEGEMLTTPMVMERDSDGIWSASIDLEPDIYCYNFVIDGARVSDAQNMYLATDRGFKRSVLNMPEAPYAINGILCDHSHVRYKIQTSANGSYEGTYAVIAPQQEAQAVTNINLVADGNDTFESWYKIAHADLILDQLLARGECKPCILWLTESEIHDSAKTLHSGDYKTWAEARKALADLLKSL